MTRSSSQALLCCSAASRRNRYRISFIRCCTIQNPLLTKASAPRAAPYLGPMAARSSALARSPRSGRNNSCRAPIASVIHCRLARTRIIPSSEAHTAPHHTHNRSEYCRSIREVKLISPEFSGASPKAASISRATQGPAAAVVVRFFSGSEVVRDSSRRLPSL